MCSAGDHATTMFNVGNEHRITICSQCKDSKEGKSKQSKTCREHFYHNCSENGRRENSKTTIKISQSAEEETRKEGSVFSAACSDQLGPEWLCCQKPAGVCGYRPFLSQCHIKSWSVKPVAGCGAISASPRVDYQSHS